MLLVFLVFSGTFAWAQDTPKGKELGEIRVPLEQIRHLGHGEFVVALFKKVDRVEMEMDKVFRVKKFLAKTQMMTVVFADVPYGEYAVGVFHDLNKNGELDTNFIGFPKEDMAISNNAKGGPLGGPTWKKSKVRLAAPILKLATLKVYPFGPDSID
jgi:uncharacterized protein (DUF2141 family)